MVTQSAPGDLEVVRGFLNTIDVEDGIDRLDEPGVATAWLRDLGLLADHREVGEADLDLLRSLRGALRDLIAARSGSAPAGGATDVLDRIAVSVGLTVTFSAQEQPGFTATAGGVCGVAGRLLAGVAGAMTDGTWQRLKLCDNDTCAWAFYDRSRNRSGRWCSMAVCGNRMKARTYRRRHET